MDSPISSAVLGGPVPTRTKGYSSTSHDIADCITPQWRSARNSEGAELAESGSISSEKNSTIDDASVDDGSPESSFSPRSNLSSSDSLASRVSATRLRDDSASAEGPKDATSTNLDYDMLVEHSYSPHNSDSVFPDLGNGGGGLKLEPSESPSPCSGPAGSPGDGVSSTQTLASGKVCVVCNDKALSCNFGAITCESCKAFFRRNAHKDFSTKCDKKCDVTVETRSYCKKCRLQKCFDMGMKTNFILSDEQKRKRKQKIFENKLRRMGNVDNPHYNTSMIGLGHGGPEYGGPEYSGPVLPPFHPMAMHGPHPGEDIGLRMAMEAGHMPPPPPSSKSHLSTSGPYLPHPSLVTPFGPVNGNVAAHLAGHLRAHSVNEAHMHGNVPISSSAIHGLSPTGQLHVSFANMSPTGGGGEGVYSSNGALHMCAGMTAAGMEQWSDDLSSRHRRHSSVDPPSMTHLPPVIPAFKGMSPPVSSNYAVPLSNAFTQHDPIVRPMAANTLSPSSVTQSHSKSSPPPLTLAPQVRTRPSPEPMQQQSVYHQSPPQSSSAVKERRKSQNQQSSGGNSGHNGGVSGGSMEFQDGSESGGDSWEDRYGKSRKRPAYIERTDSHRRTSMGSNSDGCASPTESTEAGAFSDNEPNVDISQGGLMATTLKVIRDAKMFQTKVTDLPPPMVKPVFEKAFEDPVLQVDVPSFKEVLSNLRQACMAAYDNLPDNACPSNPSYIQMINFGEETIRQLVVLAKKLPDFQALCRDDQICLLKSSVLHMMVFKSSLSYDPVIQGWLVRDGGDTRTVVPKAVRSSQEGRVLMNHYGIITISVLVSSRRDIIVIVLLIVLSLLSLDSAKPELAEVQEKDKVNAAYMTYAEFLRSYVLLKYPDRPTMYEDLLNSLSIVKDFSDTYINAILKSPVSQINPLLLEINNIISM